MKKVNINNEQDLSPTAEELINELTNVNSRIMLENLALKISLNKLQNAIKNSDDLTQQ